MLLSTLVGILVGFRSLEICQALVLGFDGPQPHKGQKNYIYEA